MTTNEAFEKYFIDWYEKAYPSDARNRTHAEVVKTIFLHGFVAGSRYALREVEGTMNAES